MIEAQGELPVGGVWGNGKVLFGDPGGQWL